MWRKGTPGALLVGMQSAAASVKAVWRDLKKLKIELSYDPATSLLSNYLKKSKILL